jgi:hypothetical protein
VPVSPFDGGRTMSPSVELPRYATVDRWREISGMSRSATYKRLGAGDLRAVKVGQRTLVDVEHALVWLAAQPMARITSPRRRV